MHAPVTPPPAPVTTAPPPPRPRRRWNFRFFTPGMGFSLRLNLWYTGFFVFGALVLFALAYILLRRELGLSDREVVRTKLEACRRPDIQGGIFGLRSHFPAKAHGSRNPALSKCWAASATTTIFRRPSREAGHAH